MIIRIVIKAAVLTAALINGPFEDEGNLAIFILLFFMIIVNTATVKSKWSVVGVCNTEF